MNFGLVIFVQSEFRKSHFDIVTLTFGPDLDTINVHHHTKFGDHKLNGSRDMNFGLVIFVQSEFWSSHRRTDRQTESEV